MKREGRRRARDELWGERSLLLSGTGRSSAPEMRDRMRGPVPSAVIRFRHACCTSEVHRIGPSVGRRRFGFRIQPTRSVSRGLPVVETLGPTPVHPARRPDHDLVPPGTGQLAPGRHEVTMALSFRCRCRFQLRVPEELAGRHARCPACDGRLLVPDPRVVAVLNPDRVRRVARRRRSEQARPLCPGEHWAFPGPGRASLT
jgi:hypothetical protein